MEKICGIICEFNPLHEGHLYVIKEARRRGDAVVCIMSGNFVQRGECAVRDKYERARAALEGGADLAVLLPFPWCAAPAEFFARAGVTIAAALGVTDLVFGSESGDVQVVRRAAAIMDDPSFSTAVDALYRDNRGYAESRYEAAKKTAPDAAEVFSSSNDSLAAEYIRQSGGLGLSFDFHAVRRIDGISASEIRKRMGFSHRLFDIERELFCLGKIAPDTFDHESGIVNRLEKCAAVSSSGSGMLMNAKTKKYTDARLRRAALFAALEVTKEMLIASPDFTVVLAANGKGREVLSGAEGIEVVAKPADAASQMFRAEEAADRLYTLALGRENGADEFLKKSPYIC